MLPLVAISTVRRKLRKRWEGSLDIAEIREPLLGLTEIDLYFSPPPFSPDTYLSAFAENGHKNEKVHRISSIRGLSNP
jgi:hypothetical protein